MQVIQEIITNIPVFFNYFFPGYFFLILYKYFSDAQDSSFEHVAIASVAISYFISLISPIVTPKTNYEDLQNLIGFALAVVLAIAAILLRKLNMRRKIFIALGNITGNQQIWYDVLQSQDTQKEGKLLRCCTCENGNEYHISGKIVLFDTYGDSGCRIALSDYIIKRVGHSEEYRAEQHGALLCLDASKLYLLEIEPYLMKKCVDAGRKDVCSPSKAKGNGSS